MREMVLNHASVPARDDSNFVNWLKDLAQGMALLVDNKVSGKNLRVCQKGSGRHENLFHALNILRSSGAREEYIFIVSLATKTPLLYEVDERINDRFRSCETTEFPEDHGAPLVLCAITDWIAVGFPTAPLWDNDQLKISFDEILDDESIAVTTEYIDNLTRSIHAGPICDRHEGKFLAGINPVFLWNNREKAFPFLTFGPDVEKNLTEIQSREFHTVVKRLIALNKTAMIWPNKGGTIPPWRTHVTPESYSVNRSKKLRQARVFKSCDGTHKLFEWHARFGSAGRIHIRFDQKLFEIEVGYIGGHLPL